MKLNWGPVTQTARTDSETTERRGTVSRCDSCQSQHGPFTFFRYRGHYCPVCAPAVYNATRLSSGGRRVGDMQFPWKH